MTEDLIKIQLLLRGDSSFAAPDLYRQCEENGRRLLAMKKNAVSYAETLPVALQKRQKDDILNVNGLGITRV